VEVIGEDYIRTARAKGMPERRVVMVHALRPSLTPVITQAGLDISTAPGGVIIIETVFGIPRLGWTVVQAINQQDLPVIVGIVILAAAFVVLVNVLVDIGYALLDPRVRLH
jgi:peptide/nickel transport system permease protein